MTICQTLVDQIGGVYQFHAAFSEEEITVALLGSQLRESGREAS